MVLLFKEGSNLLKASDIVAVELWREVLGGQLRDGCPSSRQSVLLPVAADVPEPLALMEAQRAAEAAVNPPEPGVADMPQPGVAEDKSKAPASNPDDPPLFP